ncbi:MAG TPA: hypothetical protein VH208_12935 [Myxococcaceae bacterium]|jgi:hypothetical protein|nr:hypothetical protein [Myxococcaceae bacterium]
MRWISLSLALLAGCSSYQPGDRVVTRWGTSFREGTVIKQKKALLTVQWDSTPVETVAVPAGWAVRIDAHLKPTPGAWALCADEDAWALCHLAASNGDGAKLDDGREVAAGDLLPLPAALVSWASRAGPRMAARAEATAEEVPATAGRQAHVGALVLAQWVDGTWWLAAVQTVGTSSVTVAWRDGSAPSAVRPDQVAPLTDSPELRGSAEPAFCAWAQSTRWWKASVTKNAAGALDVAYEDGTRGLARPSDCIAAKRLTRR